MSAGNDLMFLLFRKIIEQFKKIYMSQGLIQLHKIYYI